MKTVLIASVTLALSAAALGQTTAIYKLVDDSGRVTYSNKPMKGASLMELDPISTIPTPTAVILAAKAIPLAKTSAAAPSQSAPHAALAVLTPVHPTLASIDSQTQRRRDDDRRRILKEELTKEEQSLDGARVSLDKEQHNPALIAAVRVAQQAVEPSASQLAQFRQNIDKASGLIRGLQATVAEHEKNIEALKKELGALKP